MPFHFLDLANILGQGSADGVPAPFDAGLAGGHGRQEHVLLVHGSAVDSSFFDGVVAGLAGTTDLFAYDRRGYGESLGLPVDDHSLDAHARDLIAVLKHLGGARVIAHSLGANAALRAMEMRPDLVSDLLAIEPPILDGLPADDPMHANRAEFDDAVSRGKYTVATLCMIRAEGICEASAPTAHELRYRMANMQTSMMAEQPWVYRYTPNYDLLRGARITLAIGAQSMGTYHARNAFYLREQLGAAALVVPGGHNGLRDLPDEASHVLQGWLQG